MSSRCEEGHPMLELSPVVRGKHVLLPASHIRGTTWDDT